MQSRYDIQAIDTVFNLHTPKVLSELPGWMKQFISGKIGQPTSISQGISLEETLSMMDEAGIERAFLIAAKAGPEWDPVSARTSFRWVAEAVEKYPDRFLGLAGIDPTEGMRGVRELENLIKNYGFIGAHLYPHWFGLPPNQARYYPFYSKCCELDVPIQMQVGHCLRYTETRPLKSVGRPIYLDEIACDFPELKLVGIHIGWPWTEEMISVAWKHPNVYIGCDAYAPKHWPTEFVHFIDSWGQDKVIFGTDFPVISPVRARAEIEELGLRATSKKKLLRDNALKLYKLEALHST